MQCKVPFQTLIHERNCLIAQNSPQLLNNQDNCCCTVTKGNAAFPIKLYMCWNGARKSTLGNLSSASLCCPHCTAPQRPQARCSPCVWTDLLLCPSFGGQGRSGEDLCVCTCLFRHMKEFSVFVNAVLLEGLKHNDKLSNELRM